MRLQVSTGTTSGRSVSVDASRLVNMYAEASAGKSQVVLHGCPGLALDATYGVGPVRGIFYMNRVRYVVSGNGLYSNSYIGEIDGSGPVTMATNGTQLVIVTSATTGYVYDTVTGLREITDADWPGATGVDYLDGYFLFSEPNSGRFFISALNDATDINALDFATAESHPDDLVRVFVDHREVWLMGERTCEVWSNTGALDFPFERIGGAINENGLGAKFSVTKTDNSIYWLDDDGVVRRAAEGYNPIRISTHAIEYQIAKVPLSSFSAFSYTQEGHEFYVLTSDIGTFVYDAATQVWHERESIGESRWRASVHTYEGTHYVGDFENGNVYRLDLDTFTENGQEQVAEILFPPIFQDGERFRVHSVRLDMEAGTANSPQVMLQTSKDGKTWSNEVWRSFGDLGEYTNRVVWRRLGLFETCHLRFRISSPAKRAVFAAYAEIG